MTQITGPNGSVYADNERLIFKEPIGPVLTDHARPLIENRILDVARIAIHDPARYDLERTRLSQQLREQYMDGQIRIPYDHTQIGFEDALEVFLDNRINERTDIIKSGVDLSLFDVQRESVELMAAQLAEARKKNRVLVQENVSKQKEISEVHDILAQHVSPELLARIDQKLGFKVEDVVEPIMEKSQASFGSVVEEGSGLRPGFLDHVRLVKPPQSAEVELVNTQRSVA